MFNWVRIVSATSDLKSSMFYFNDSFMLCNLNKYYIELVEINKENLENE